MASHHTIRPLRSRVSQILLSLLATTEVVLKAGSVPIPAKPTAVPAAPLVGQALCRPGFAAPDCLTAPFDIRGNLAAVGNGAAKPAVSKDVRPHPPSLHRPEFANDGHYGNGSSWGSHSPDSWIKIDLGKVVSIDRVRFGRDRVGLLDNRDPGQITIQTAMSENAYANGDDSNDTLEYTTVFQTVAPGFPGTLGPGESLEASFLPVQARYIKVQLSHFAASLDEVEVFGFSALTAKTRGNPNALTVQFSQPVDPISATMPQNYAISGGVTIHNVLLLETAKVRLLTTPIAAGQPYTLTLTGIKSSRNESMPAGNQLKFFQTQGGITRKEYHDIDGVLLADLTASSKYPSKPDVVAFSENLESPVDVRDRYGVVLAGYLTAPATGDFVFYVNSDDQGDLWLSTDEDPAHKVRIAREPEWNPSRQWSHGLSEPNQLSRHLPPDGFFTDALFIEGEDYDFGGGQYVKDKPIGMTGPYPGGSYANLGTMADAEIDWHKRHPEILFPIYRPQTGSETGNPTSSPATNSRGDFSLAINFTLGWNDSGDWFNYTRSFPMPARDYHVYGSFGTLFIDQPGRFQEVTAGRGTPNQTLADLGTFTIPKTGSWDTYRLVPLRQANGQLAKVKLGGERTLRQDIHGGYYNFDHFVFKPATTDPTPASGFPAANISRPIPLVAGRRYYIEARMKEHGGGDNLAVAWRLPGAPSPQRGASPISGDFLDGLAPLAASAIATHPTGRSVQEFEPVTFSVSLTGTEPFDYQWFRNGVAIEGANKPSYSLSSVTRIDDGQVFTVRAGNGLNSEVSQAATLNVQHDRTGPTLLATHGVIARDAVRIRFSEQINSQDAGGCVTPK